MNLKAKHESGVVIETGLQDWQIIQQNKSGLGEIQLAGRWLTQAPYKKAKVIVRVMDENRLVSVTKALDWRRANTKQDGTWSICIKSVPAGGLYRIETALQLNDGPVEWAKRGDMRHHVGVGDIWVIAGQSNAAGYGKTPCFDPPEMGIHIFHSSGEWRLATHPFSDSTGSQYPANREDANGSHSPFLAFARCLKGALGYPVGLIPAALGGSPISRWVRGDAGDLFENMMDYIRDSGGACRGMVWYQGESDTGPDQRNVYAKKFEKMVWDFRSSLRRQDLPVLTAQLNRYIGEPYDRPCHEAWEIMREIQRQLAHRIKGVEVISTLDLGLSDGIHNESKANLTIGERLADTALGAVYGRNVKYRCPDLRHVSRVACDAVELEFDHIDTRLHFENNIPEQFPFVVRDDAGVVPLKAWRMRGKNRLRITLARPIQTGATVTGAHTACPPSVIPYDLCGYLPMLAFTVPLAKLEKE